MRVIVISSWYWEGWGQILSIWLSLSSSLMVVTNVYNTKAKNHLLVTTFALNPQLEHWRSWFLWARIHFCHVADSWIYCISVFHEAFKARPRLLWLLFAIFRQSFQAKLMHHCIIIFMQLVHYLCYICPWHININHCASETGLAYVTIFSKKKQWLAKIGNSSWSFFQVDLFILLKASLYSLGWPIRCQDNRTHFPSQDDC